MKLSMTTYKYGLSITGFAAAVPGLPFLQIPEGAGIGDVIAAIYRFGLGLVGISALIMLVIGGLMYMLAGDKDPTQAKKFMRNAIYGLLLALISWLILYTINPQLVTKLELNLTPIKPVENKFAGALCDPAVADSCGPGLICRIISRNNAQCVAIGQERSGENLPCGSNPQVCKQYGLECLASARGFPTCQRGGPAQGVQEGGSCTLTPDSCDQSRGLYCARGTPGRTPNICRKR